MIFLSASRGLTTLGCIDVGATSSGSRSLSLLKSQIILCRSFVQLPVFACMLLLVVHRRPIPAWYRQCLCLRQGFEIEARVYIWWWWVFSFALAPPDTTHRVTITAAIHPIVSSVSFL
jgi:hypothetical protein